MTVSLTALQQTPLTSRSEEAFQQKFQDLASRWRRETALRSSVTAMAMHSSVTAMAMHPAYQQIIGMGTPALPLIFQELEREPDH